MPLLLQVRRARRIQAPQLLRHSQLVPRGGRRVRVGPQRSQARDESTQKERKSILVVFSATTKKRHQKVGSVTRKNASQSVRIKLFSKDKLFDLVALSHRSCSFRSPRAHRRCGSPADPQRQLGARPPPRAAGRPAGERAPAARRPRSPAGQERLLAPPQLADDTPGRFLRLPPRNSSQSSLNTSSASFSFASTAAWISSADISFSVP